MRRWPLAAWLGLLTLGVVALVAGALAPAALVLLGRLAEENARSRVRLAALGAAEAVEVRAEALATSARLLAERPTLLRLAAADERAELAAFVERFRSTGSLDGAAVLRAGEVVAASPAALPWREIGQQVVGGPGFHPPLAGEGAPLATGRSPVTGAAGTEAIVLARLDAAAARQLGQQMGAGVRILWRGSVIAPSGASEYRAEATAGEPAAVTVVASMPRSEAASALAPLRRRFGAVTLGATLFAVAAGTLVGRALARPLAVMRGAAARIGAGDLATPVRSAGGAEMASLAATLDEMRRRLRSLTGELRHREAEAQALLSGIVEGVFAVDGERRIEYLNAQAAALLGVAPAEAVGRFCGDVLRPVGPDGRRPCEDRCPIVHARSRGSSRAVEHLHLAAGRRTVVVTSAPEAGSRQVQVLRDETETEAARRTRDAVLANLSHELKTPLSAQLASIELLRDGMGALDPAAAAEVVTTLERSTLRLVRLVDNLLESVRIETGQAAVRRHLPVDLAALVADAAAVTEPLLRQRGQRVEIGELESLPPLLGDSTQLAQVLVNLLANAQKYAPEGSTIRVGGGVERGAVSLWVEDSGPGVPPALSASIFDRFHRAAADGDGMGLGLWIAKSIVERHGGRIAVSGAAQGGARFTLTFPAPEVAA